MQDNGFKKKKAHKNTTNQNKKHHNKKTQLVVSNFGFHLTAEEFFSCESFTTSKH